MVKNLPANAGDTGDMDLIPRSGRSPGGGHGNHSSILPRESHGQRSLTSYSPHGRKESDIVKQLSGHTTPLSSCMYSMVFLLFSAAVPFLCHLGTASFFSFVLPFSFVLGVSSCSSLLPFNLRIHSFVYSEFESLLWARHSATQYSVTAENMTGRIAGVAGEITSLQFPGHRFSLTR